MAHAEYVAVWYDPDKVKTKAKALGWREDDDSLLDVYDPIEDAHGHDGKLFRDLQSAVTHLRNIVANGRDFFGQAEVVEIEIGGRRCRYCTCEGHKVVKRHDVDESGITQTHNVNDCLDDEG